MSSIATNILYNTIQMTIVLIFLKRGFCDCITLRSLNQGRIDSPNLHPNWGLFIIFLRSTG